MEVVEWINIIISILSGIAVCIPLVLSLINFVKSPLIAKILPQKIGLLPLLGTFHK